jgi:REP-associated tyrosine transposase
MARPLRPQVADGLYHVTSRGNRGQPIVGDDADCKQWLETLEGVVITLEWQCHAYCLLTNHFHLFVRTPHPNISKGMHRLNSLHAEWINWRYGYKGHVFQGRFKSTLVEHDSHAFAIARYIPLNPVKAGMCRRPESFRWSSYAATIGRAPRPEFLADEWLLGLFHEDGEKARRMYAAFVRLAELA